MSIKRGYYEQFYPQKLLSENLHFQIYSSEGCFMDLTSTFIGLRVKKSNSEKSSAARAYPMKMAYYTFV